MSSSTYVIEILSVLKPPIKLGFITALECPCCEYWLDEHLNIDLNTFEVDDNTEIYCGNCDTLIRFKIILDESFYTKQK